MDNSPQPLSGPTVSVIMNCYNSARYLAEAIGSVYAQTFTDWEIIFLDNCSTDGSAGIAQKYDHKLRYYRNEQNVPLGQARNLALARARGKYVAFLDCDDVWVNIKLERQVAAMENNPRAGMAFAGSFFFSADDPNRQFQVYRRRMPVDGNIFADLLASYFMQMSTIVVRRSVLDTVGGYFDDRFNMVEDADFFMRIAHDYPVEYVPEPLSRRRMHCESWTALKKELFPKEEEMLLAKFAALWPNFEKDYAAAIAQRRAYISYEYAVLDWEKGDGASARRHLWPHLQDLKKAWIPFLFSFFPYPVYRRLKFIYKSVTAPFFGSVDYQAF